ncbi:hypothetical protein AB6T38_01490 [Aliiglaciecola sp. SL4]|uniref:hypothetical protein n=1 Tax=Aliiglaciecola sp. SL4 TaxID=3239806 RepID=UPI00355B24B9
MSYENIDVFDVDGVNLFHAIAVNESKSHMFNEFEYVFPDQIITLWEMEEQYDYLGNHKLKVCAQVGIGTKSYFHVVNG